MSLVNAPVMAPVPMPLSETAGKLIEVMTLQGEEPVIDLLDGEREEKPVFTSIAYFPNRKQIITGGPNEKSARRWDLQRSKEVGEARFVCEQEILAVTVSRDGRWVVIGGGDLRCGGPGELKACEVETGIVKTFEGHSSIVTCIDISADSTLLASGSIDHTVQIWNLDTGELVAGPFKLDSVDILGAVRFSQDSRKLAMNSAVGKSLEVWDIEAQALDVRVGKRSHLSDGFIWLPATPVFWTTNDKTIVAACNFTDGIDEPARVIYEFNSSTLQIVGAPFEGHIHRIVLGLALSVDFTLLVSASDDCAIKLWAFESRQLLASIQIQRPCSLTLSLDSRQIAYTTFGPGSHKIYICNISLDILAYTNTPRNPHIGDPLNSGATVSPATVRRGRAAAPLAARPLRPSPTVHIQQSAVLRHLRKLVPSSFRRDAVPPVQNVEPRDPLDVLATSSLHPNVSHSARGTAGALNSRTTPIPPRPRLSNPIRAGHALPPSVNVPLAQGKERNAAAGAPKGNGGYTRDEDYDPPQPSPNPNSRQPSAAVQTNVEEHGRGRLCFCL